MSLQIKTICSWKLDGIPGVNNIYNKIPKLNLFVDEQFVNNITNPLVDSSQTKIDDDSNDKLIVMCIQGVYGYRTGLLGKMVHTIAEYFSFYSNPMFFQNIFNFFYTTDANDYELTAYITSLLSRIIPINNHFTYDVKDRFKTFAYKNENNSQPSLFDIKSLFLLEPIYDSGCAIFSNKNYTECGFEKWESTFVREKYTNKGMTWCYYESESKQNGITIINLDFINNNNDLSDLEHLQQLTSLKTNLETKFYTDILKKYETYIAGNFNILFNMSEVVKNIDDKLTILKNANIRIINNHNDASSEKYIMYSKVEKNIEPELHFIDHANKYEETYFYKVNIHRKIELHSKKQSLDIVIEMDENAIELENTIENGTVHYTSDASENSEGWDYIT